jgi:hypothetical protein
MLLGRIKMQFAGGREEDQRRSGRGTERRKDVEGREVVGNGQM